MAVDVGRGCYGHRSHDLSKSYFYQHDSFCTLGHDTEAPKRDHKRYREAIILESAQVQTLLFFLSCDRYSLDQQGRTFAPKF